MQPRLFEPEKTDLHAHITWKAEEGWSLWINAWAREEGPVAGQSEGYERLTFSELLDVLEASVASAMPWVRPRY